MRLANHMLGPEGSDRPGSSGCGTSTPARAALAERIERFAADWASPGAEPADDDARARRSPASRRSCGDRVAAALNRWIDAHNLDEAGDRLPQRRAVLEDLLGGPSDTGDRRLKADEAYGERRREFVRAARGDVAGRRGDRGGRARVVADAAVGGRGGDGAAPTGIEVATTALATGQASPGVDGAADARRGAHRGGARLGRPACSPTCPPRSRRPARHRAAWTRVTYATAAAARDAWSAAHAAAEAASAVDDAPTAAEAGDDAPAATPGAPRPNVIAAAATAVAAFDRFGAALPALADRAALGRAEALDRAGDDAGAADAYATAAALAGDPRPRCWRTSESATRASGPAMRRRPRRRTKRRPPSPRTTAAGRRRWPGSSPPRRTAATSTRRRRRGCGSCASCQHRRPPPSPSNGCARRACP
ncbi:MAG: hypothetical protein U0470_04455 [Anaerolineae bacterium]